MSYAGHISKLIVEWGKKQFLFYFYLSFAKYSIPLIVEHLLFGVKGEHKIEQSN